MDRTATATVKPPDGRPPLYPLRFEPVLKRLIWGGRRLATELHKPLGEGDDYAESWELADHEHGQSRVTEGPLAGVSLNELVRTRGAELLGPAIGLRSQFPILVKFIDARRVLSVQVHPDDERGQRLAGDNGKTEAWVVVHADPGSWIYAGLKPGVDRDRFAAALSAGHVDDLLHRVPAKAGDCIFIPAGTVHAIGAGVLLAEIQQTSDATFRVYDWGRLGPDGQPRPLHVAEALASIDFAAGPIDPTRPDSVPCPGGRRELLARCPYFAIERRRIEAPTVVGTPERFTALVGLSGRAEVRSRSGNAALEKGQTVLLPAALGPCELAAIGGPATFLVATVP